MIIKNNEETLMQFVADRERLRDIKDGIKYTYRDGVSIVSWR